MIVIRNRRAYMASSVCDEPRPVGGLRVFPDLSVGESRRKRDRQTRYSRRYGITYEQRHQMYLDQNRCCKLCGDSMAYGDVHTDHDHKTDKIRGLLCRRCNIGLGFFQDDPMRLSRAIEYLGK